jgi:hypothetical protein
MVILPLILGLCVTNWLCGIGTPQARFEPACREQQRLSQFQRYHARVHTCACKQTAHTPTNANAQQKYDAHIAFVPGEATPENAHMYFLLLDHRPGFKVITELLKKIPWYQVAMG